MLRCLFASVSVGLAGAVAALPAFAQTAERAAATRTAPALQHQPLGDAAARALAASRAAQQPKPPPARVVPNLVDRSCAEAQRLLLPLKLELACRDGARYGQRPAGRINEQRPAAGAALPADRRVLAFTEPRAPPEPDPAPALRVPDVSGYTAVEAAARLRAAQLAPQVKDGEHDAFHVVTATRPPAGAAARRGQPVALQTVGRYRVPDLARLSCAQAIERAHAAGFATLRCETQDPGRAWPAATVHAQQPAAGTVLREPGEILVRIARAAAPPERATLRVPALEGLALADAVARLQRLGLSARTRGPSQAPRLRVQRQSPAAGSLVPLRSTVVLEALIVVPDLRNSTCNAARLSAREAGLDELRCEPMAPPDAAAAPGRAFFQDPAAGTLLAAPAPVLLHIALRRVPDVQSLPLAEAETALAGQGLRAEEAPPPGYAAAPGVPDERRVIDQQPPANTVVEPDAAVLLRTERLLAAPELQGLDCEAARARVPAGLRFECRPDEQTLAWGRARIYAQQPAAGARLPEGAVLAARARVEPAWLGPAAAGALLLSLIGAAGGVAWKARPRATGSGPAPQLRLEPRADPAPAVVLRFERPPGVALPPLTLRGEPGVGAALLVGLHEPAAGAAPDAG